MPVPSNNPAGGIFQFLVQPQGTRTQVNQAQLALQQASPYIAAVYQALNMLPEGDLKKWLTANPIQFFKMVIQLFKGRKFTIGQYKLGERYLDQIVGKATRAWSDVGDDIVPIAQMMFTVLFGVRITTGEDLDALNFGVNKYYERGEKNDIPVDAVERAVFLAQRYYPIDSYNRYQWDLKYFEMYPLVAPIPGIDEGTLYTGELPGGARAINGIIPVSAASVLQQIPGGDFDPNTGNITTPTGEVITPGSTADASAGGSVLDNLISYVKANPLVGAIFLAGVGYAVYEIEEND